MDVRQLHGGLQPESVHQGADQLDRYRPDRDVVRRGRGDVRRLCHCSLEFRGKRLLLSLALAIAMFPQAALVGPLFNMWRGIGIYDTWLGLIIPYLTFALPLSIWTMSAFFRQIPWGDGTSRASRWRHGLAGLPQSDRAACRAGVFTTAILTFFFCWNDFLFAISLTSTDAARTVPAALAFFRGASQFESPVPYIMAAAVVVTIPVVILVLAFQRRIVAGLTSGAVKG